MSDFSDNFSRNSAEKFAQDMWSNRSTETDIASFSKCVVFFHDSNLIYSTRGDPTTDEGESFIIFNDFSRIQFDRSKGNIKVSTQEMMDCCDVFKIRIKEISYTQAIVKMNRFICHRWQTDDSAIFIFKDFSIAFTENEKVVSVSNAKTTINTVFKQLLN